MATYRNMASTRLAEDLAAGGGSVAVEDGSVFSSLSTPFYATIRSAEFTEVVSVTGVTGDTIAITRAQDGTSARAFSAGDFVSIRDTSALMGSFIQGPEYRSSVGSPVGVLTPAFIGEKVFESTTPSWYISVGLTAADWKDLCGTPPPLDPVTRWAAGVIASFVGITASGGVSSVHYPDTVSPCALGGRTPVSVSTPGGYTAVVFSDGTMGLYSGDGSEYAGAWQYWSGVRSVAEGAGPVAVKFDGTISYISGGVSYDLPDVTNAVQAVTSAWGLGFVYILLDDGTVTSVDLSFYPDPDATPADTSSWSDIVQLQYIGEKEWVFGLKSDGTVLSAGSAPPDVSAWTDIVMLSCSGFGSHILGLKSDGTCVATGLNASGQCNVGAWTDIVMIGTAARTSWGIKSDGSDVAAGEYASVLNYTAVLWKTS